MATWVVLHRLMIDNEEMLVPRLVVTEAPEEVDADRVKQAITEAGLAPSEARVPWANHQVRRLADVRPDIRAGIENGTTSASFYTWTDLATAGRTVVNFNLRIPKPVHAKLEDAAREDGLSKNEYILKAIRQALDADLVTAR